MKRLLPFLILLASVFGLSAANPSFRDTTNVVNALNLWTNSSDGFVYLAGKSPTNGPSFSTNSFYFGHPPASAIGPSNPFLIALDGSKGDDPSYAQFTFEGTADFGAGEIWSHTFFGSTNNAVGYQMYYNDGAGHSEYFDLNATGDVYSQFLFSTTAAGYKDSNPLVMAPNFVGADITPLTAYKFGTSHILTNGTGTIAQFLNAGTNVLSVDPIGGISNSTFQTTSTKTTNAVPFDSAGIISGYAGLASYSTDATNQIPTTGWTNDLLKNVTVYTTATAVSFTINNRAGTVLYTSPTLTATMPVNLQPGWSVRAASGLTGTVLPF